eukprot:gene8845-25918_t
METRGYGLPASTSPDQPADALGSSHPSFAHLKRESPDGTNWVDGHDGQADPSPEMLWLTRPAYKDGKDGPELYDVLQSLDGDVLQQLSEHSTASVSIGNASTDSIGFPANLLLPSVHPLAGARATETAMQQASL